MKAKETAEKLVDKYKKTNLMGVSLLTTEAKQCALIAVNEILNEIHYNNVGFNAIARLEYWYEVRNEIEKL